LRARWVRPPSTPKSPSGIQVARCRGRLNLPLAQACDWL